MGNADVGLNVGGLTVKRVVVGHEAVQGSDVTNDEKLGQVPPQLAGDKTY